MASSFQNEIPQSRVNITLDLDNDGQQAKKEIPMKLLAIGNFSHGQCQQSVHNRKRVNINKSNFNEVMTSLSPTINLQVPNKINEAQADLSCQLSFNSIKDFSPERVVESVEPLNKLLAMRNLLKDLKASILDNQAFRKKLEVILNDQQQAESLDRELKKLVIKGER